MSDLCCSWRMRRDAVVVAVIAFAIDVQDLAGEFAGVLLAEIAQPSEGFTVVSGGIVVR